MIDEENTVDQHPKEGQELLSKIVNVVYDSHNKCKCREVIRHLISLSFGAMSQKGLVKLQIFEDLI